MKFLIFILLPFFSLSQNITVNSFGSPITINAIGKPSTISINQDIVIPSPDLTDYTKDIKVFNNQTGYNAFGFCIKTGPDRITAFFRHGDTHLTNGVIQGQHFTISTEAIGTPFEIYADPGGLDMRDVWGGIMDNNEIILFSCSSEYTGDPETGNLKSHALMLRLDINMNVLDTVSLFNGSVPEMQRGLPFAGMQKGIAAGTYYQAMWQFNSDAGTVDKPTFPLYRIDVLKTTDYWDTWTVLNVYEGTLAQSECALAVYPDEDHMRMFVRRDPGGMMRLYESVNAGVNWTDRGNLVDLGVNGTQSKMPFALINSSGLMDIMVQDRSDGWIKLSRNNPTSNFGSVALEPDECWYFNRAGSITVGSNFKLGYTSMIELAAEKYFIMFARQPTLTQADLYYSFDDFIKTEVPITPNLIVLPSSITTTTALVYCKMDDDIVDGYTLKELENIQYFEWSISTDNFATFTTARIRFSSGSYSFAGVINSYRLSSQLLNIYELTAATTYKVRCRAVNDFGASSWSEVEFTTD